MSDENKEVEAAVQETERRKCIKANVKRWRAELQDSARLAVEAIAKVTPIGEAAPSLDEQSKILGEAVHAVREVVRPEPKTVAFLEEHGWYHVHSTYHTPKAAVDFVLGNPPLGTVEPGAKPLSPDAPELARGENPKERTRLCDIPEIGIEYHQYNTEEYYKFLCWWHNKENPRGHVYEVTVKPWCYDMSPSDAPAGSKARKFRALCQIDGRVIFSIESGNKNVAIDSALSAMRAHHRKTHRSALRTLRRAEAAKQQADDNKPPHPAPLSPEEELADTIASQKGEEVES